MNETNLILGEKEIIISNGFYQANGFYFLVPHNDYYTKNLRYIQTSCRDSLQTYYNSYNDSTNIKYHKHLAIKYPTLNIKTFAYNLNKVENIMNLRGKSKFYSVKNMSNTIYIEIGSFWLVQKLRFSFFTALLKILSTNKQHIGDTKKEILKSISKRYLKDKKYTEQFIDKNKKLIDLKIGKNYTYNQGWKYVIDSMKKNKISI